MTICSLIVLLPLVLLFMSSITDEASLIKYGYNFIPHKFSLSAYSYIWNNRSIIFRCYLNTIIVTIVGTVAHVLMATAFAYPLSLPDLPAKNVINFLLIFTMLFNGGLVPSYIMWTNWFHVKNTLWALIIPGHLLSAMNIILVRTYMRTSIPGAIYEAAKIDGANYFTIFWKIVLPLSKPILVTISVFTGLGYWNDWVNCLYYISDRKFMNIQGYLNKMITDINALLTNPDADASAIANIPQVSIRMAIAFVALAPILIIYPFLQKYFASGIALGAVKG
jgi:putative aldouronate transport system permease protein